MSQSVKEFVRQSGVEVQSPNSNSNDEFARELDEVLENAERDRRRTAAAPFFRTPPRPVRPMRPVPRSAQVPQRLQNNLITNQRYEPLANEFREALAGITFNDKNLNYIAPRSALEISKLNPGMFNATVDSGFGQKDTLIELKKILLKTPLGRTPIGEGLYIDTKEIKGIYGQFKTGFSHTKESGPRGDTSKVFSSAQFILTLSNDVESKGATVNFYKNGKIRFSGGFIGTNITNQPELIRRFMVDTYTEKQPFFYNPFTYNNLSGQFRVNGTFKSLARIAQKSSIYGMTRVSYEPELAPFLYAYFGEMKFILSTSGNVQISGAKNPGDMLASYDFGKTFVQDLNAKGEIDVTGVFEKGVKTKVSKPKPKPKPKPNSKPKRKYTKRTLTTNQANAIMINSKMCARMKKSELMDLARRMGVVNFRITTKDGSRLASKDEICSKIKKQVGKENVTVNNKKLVGTGNTFRVGRKICTDMKKEQLVRVAGILKITLDEKETKKSLCKKIEKVRNNLAKPKPKPVAPPKPTKREVQRKKTNMKVGMKKAEVMKKRGLDENSIRKDITKLYGDKWLKRYKPNLNQDVRNMKSALNAITKGNKIGIPFKKDIDDVKKTVVGRWKMERRRELERKYLMNTANVTGIAYNLRNAYRRAAANYIMNQKTAPSNKKMADYRKYWLKFRANLNGNGQNPWNKVTRAARGRNFIPARARIEKV
jgi:hypothetical protein